MWVDPIVEELHRWRKVRAARLYQDLRAMVADLRAVEREWSAPKIAPPVRREPQAETLP